jgi:hypothetical protein
VSEWVRLSSSEAGTGDWVWYSSVLVGWAFGGLAALHVQEFLSVVRWRHWNSTGRSATAPRGIHHSQAFPPATVVPSSARGLDACLYSTVFLYACPVSVRAT